MTQQITAQLLKGGLTVDASGNVTAIGRFSGPTQRTGIIKAQDGTTAITIADSTGKITIAGDLEVNGTTTTLDTTLENVDKLEVGANSTDYGAKINQAGTGDILQLQDGGTTVFVVEDGGNVGIGIDAPSNLLHVYNNTATTGSEIKIENATAGYNSALQIKTTVSDWDIGSNINATAGSFEVYERTSGSAGSRFTILSAGNVGINAVAPRTKLEVVQSAFGAGQGIRLAKTLSEYWDIDIFADASNKLTFSNYNAGQVMTMDNSGKVGIGTTSPGNLLSVEADGGASWISTHHNTASSGNASGLLAKTTVESGTGYIFACNSNNSYKFVVKPDGNVGIGETVPLANLHVRSEDSGGNLNAGVDEFCVEGSGDTGMTILSGATSNGAVWFGKIGDNGRGRIDFDQNDGSMSFATTNIKRLIIDTSGHVGIGAAPSNPGGMNKSLEVIHDTEMQFVLHATTNSLPTDARVGQICFNVGTVSSIPVTSSIIGKFAGSTNKGYLTFHCRDGEAGGTPSERLRISNVGHVTPGGNGTQDLGATGSKWANLWVNDLQLSNEGNPNEIDGTEGTWTVQEGDENLFVINRKTGKKFKINLTEV